MKIFTRREDVPKFLRVGYLAHHIRCLPRWSENYQAPDPVAFADYADLADDFAALWIRDAPIATPVAFRYPKPSGSLRNLTLISPRDSARFRTVVGAVLEVAERRLGKTVFSARVAASPPMWRFKSHPYYKFVREVKGGIRQWSCAGMTRTDVRDFFPTLQPEHVLRYLWDSGCDKASAIFLVNAMLELEDLRICKGLPIGPEASAVVGSFYLAPIDEILLGASCSHYRYMDDIAYLYPASLGRERCVELLDEALYSSHLNRSVDKTRHADNPIDALDLIERFDLAYVVAYKRRIPGIPIDVVKEIFEEVVASRPVDVPALRSCLSALGSSHDPYATQALLERPTLFDSDPKSSADYLRVLEPSQELGNELVRQLRGDRNDGARLHIIRAAEAHGTDTSNGTYLLEHAADPSDLLPIRAWAISAYQKSPIYSPIDLLDALEDVDEIEVRRAAIISLRRAPRVGRKFAARLLTRDSSELKLTSQWSLASAA